MRFCYDSLNWQAIPHDSQLVAYYVQWPGAWANSPQGDGVVYWRGQGKIMVPIASQAHINDGVVLDVEAGDATPGQVPGWLNMRRAAGVEPTVYMASSNWGACQQACSNAGIAHPHWWVAQWDGNPAIPGGAVAKQFQSTNAWDKSSVLDFWPGVDASSPASPPRTRNEEIMAIFEMPNGSLYTSNLVQFRWLIDGEAVNAAKWVIAEQGGNPTFNTIGRWQDMGVPADQQSAGAAGAPWPPQAA